MAQSVKRPTWAQVMILWSMGLSPASGSVLTARSLEPASESVSPSLSAPPLLTLHLSHQIHHQIPWILSSHNMSHVFVPLFKKKIFFNVYLFWRERGSSRTSGGGAEREGNTETKAGSRLRAVSTEPDAGLEPTNCEIMT